MEPQTIAIALFSIASVISASLLIYYFMARGKTAAKKPAAKPAAQKRLGEPASKSVIAANTPILDIPPHIPRTLETIIIMAEERPEIVAKVVRKWMDEWQQGNNH